MRVLASAIMFVVLAVGISGQSAQKPKKFLTAPVTIEDQGSFFVGGVTKVSEYAGDSHSHPGSDGAPRPRRSRSRSARCTSSSRFPPRKSGPGWPVIMVHGSTHTGAAPRVDARRPRGLVSVLRAQRHRDLRRRPIGPRALGLRSVGAARSRVSAATAGDTRARAAELIPNFWAHHRHRRLDATGSGTSCPANSTILTGKLIPHGDPADPQPASGRLRARRAAVPDRRRWIRRSSSRAGAIGPAPAGAPETFALEYYKQLVPNAEVTLPGSICDTCDPKEIAPANTWTPQNLASLVERLGGAIVVTHSQSGIMGHHMARILKERAGFDPGRNLVTVEALPLLKMLMC